MKHIKTFLQIKEWEKFVDNIQKKLIPAFQNDDAQLLDNIIKEYKLDINEYLFHRLNPGRYKNNLLHEYLEKEAILSKNQSEPKMNIIKYLIDNGADINMYNKYNETPLLIYLQYSRSQKYGEKSNDNFNIKIVKYLLDNNANPNLSDGNIQTPLTYCSNHTGLKLMKLLIKYGADPYFGKIQGSYLYTPYRAYFNDKNLDKLIYLITEYNIDPFEIHKNLLFNGYMHSDGNFFDYFLDYGPKDEKKKHEFIKAIYPDLLEYKFQNYIINKYGHKGIEKILKIGVNTKIMKEKEEDITIYLNSIKYNL